MVIVTQFVFDPEPVASWIERLAALGINMPIHVGIAGPAKLTTLIKYAAACGVGPSVKVLQNRGKDMTKLMLPYDPLNVIAGLVAHRAAKPESLVRQIHFYPFGGVRKTAEWANGVRLSSDTRN
jgi:methylenetetrahydrofolate reductase (NADPH)